MGLASYLIRRVRNGHQRSRAEVRLGRLYEWVRGIVGINEKCIVYLRYLWVGKCRIARIKRVRNGYSYPFAFWLFWALSVAVVVRCSLCLMEAHDLLVTVAGAVSYLGLYSSCVIF